MQPDGGFVLNRIDILGIRIDALTLQESVGRIVEYMASGTPHQIVTANPEIIMKALDDAEYRGILSQASLVTGDGSGVVWAAQTLRTPLPERVTGIDLLNSVLPRLVEKNYGIYLLGGAPGTVEKAAAQMQQAFPGLVIAGKHHGYLTAEDEKNVIGDIIKSKPHILAIGMGAPRQEKWLAAHLDELGIPVGIGIGGSLDVWAGEVKRAPGWIRKISFEWLYRMIRQPARFKRAWAIPHFMYRVKKESLKRKQG